MKNNKELGKISTYDMFEGNALDPRYLFVHRFREYPQSLNIYMVDILSASKFVLAEFSKAIDAEYSNRSFNAKNNVVEVDEIAVVFKRQIVVHFEDDRVHILYARELHETVLDMAKRIGKFRRKERRKPFEIHILVGTSKEVELRSIEIKRTRLDLGLYYEDDFKEVDALIQKRLNSKKDKGLVLLHGLPGTGKTTYLRYLIGKLRKRVIFLSSDAAEAISGPDFTQLLLRNPESVLVFEDAENMIADRAISNRNSVAGLLNLSDGLMSDILNVQIICTFNKPLTMIDDALLRKGRLIARYEFDKLGINKAQKLSDHLGLDQIILEPMTLAEIANPSEEGRKEVVKRTIGFTSTLINK